MRHMSRQYKDTMKEACRERSFVRVYIGLINQIATQAAKVVDGPYTYFSNLHNPLKSEIVTNRYATLEQDYNLIDGSMYFLPRDSSDLYNAGIVTEELCMGGKQPEITINFETDEALDIKGLSIDFGLTWPEKFEIEIDGDIRTYINDSPEFETEEVFENITFITLRAIKMNKGANRFRIEKIMFGIGLTYDGDKIISANIKSTISPISENLPTTDFSVEIDNGDKYFNVDNEDSALRYLETGQQLIVYFGQELLDNNVEWQKAATLSVQEWEADDKTATFRAVDEFSYMQDIYRKGEYREGGISLYDLAVHVCEDAGLPSEGYWIDPYLKKVITQNPLPSIMHKECLQLIANAGRSVVMQNRDGMIILKSSFVPELSVTAVQEIYSDAEALLTNGVCYEYVGFEENFIKVDGTQLFLPRSDNYNKSCYTSKAFTDEEGVFDEEPAITIELESAYTFFGITLLFGSVVPENFIMRTYNNEVLLHTIHSDIISYKTVINHDFIDVDKVEIIIKKALPFNRVHIDKIILGEATNYEMSYDELIETPKGMMLEKVKEIHVQRTIYAKGIERKDLMQEEIVLGEKEEFEYEFGTPVHDLTAEIKVDEEILDCGLQIVEYGTYYCKVRATQLPPSPIKAVLFVNGYEYSISTVSEKRKLNNAGKVITSQNPLISTSEDAENALEWIGDFYMSGAVYNLYHRGEPALDSNDLMKLESQHNNELLVRIEENETNFESGVITGRTSARRENVMASYRILKTLKEVMNNSTSGYLVDALAIKEFANSVNSYGQVNWSAKVAANVNITQDIAGSIKTIEQEVQDD